MQLTNQRQAFFRALCWVLLVGLLFPLRARAQGALVSLLPEGADLPAAETRQLSVRLEGAANVYGAHVELRFDPAHIQIVDPATQALATQVAAGDFFQEEGFVARNVVDNEAGTVLWAFTLLNPAVPVTGDGALITFTVQGTAPGASGLAFERVLLSTNEGQPVANTIQPITLTVSGEQTQEPAVATATVPTTAVPTSTPSFTTPSPMPTAQPPTSAPATTVPATVTTTVATTVATAVTSATHSSGPVETAPARAITLTSTATAVPAVVDAPTDALPAAEAEHPPAQPPAEAAAVAVAEGALTQTPFPPADVDAEPVVIGQNTAVTPPPTPSANQSGSGSLMGVGLMAAVLVGGIVLLLAMRMRR